MSVRQRDSVQNKRQNEPHVYLVWGFFSQYLKKNQRGTKSKFAAGLAALEMWDWDSTFVMLLLQIALLFLIF